MKICLLFQEHCSDKPFIQCSTPTYLNTDLELGRILEHMADGDSTIHKSCEEALFCPLQSPEAIKHRQAVLQDAFQNPDAVRKLYKTVAGIDSIPAFFSSPARVLENFYAAVKLLAAYTKTLLDLRNTAEKTLKNVQSAGFRHLLDTLRREMTDEYFSEVQKHLSELKNKDILFSAKLGGDLRIVDYTLRRMEKDSWLRWRLSPSYTVKSEERLYEFEDLRRRRGHAVSEAKNILLQAARFLQSFLATLQKELAFYVGCLNLADKMHSLGMPVCIPTLLPHDSYERSWRGLYDMSLALATGSAVVGNALEAAGKRLYLITGANQGGKSTFLRSIGQAQLMAQCGMPVGAESFTAPVRREVFTHFKKEEDAWMKSGKLDEELERMDIIAGRLQRGSLVLFNESFASTNEPEGSEICCQITRSLVENDVEVFAVTHLYTYASAFLGDSGTQFLLAERLEDSRRTFKILPGEPLETAYGEDLYKKIFGS